MNRDLAPAPGILRQHFFQSLFRLGFLDDAGEESFKRAIIGMLAGIVAFGLLLARMYLGKYAQLASLPTADLYRLMLPADQLLLISVTMFVIALVMALASPSIFPDETDFRILMPLPVPRHSIFVAKAEALFFFAAIFVIGTCLGLGLPFSLVSGGTWADQPLVLRSLAQTTTWTLASIFAVAGIIAIQGLITVLTLSEWRRTASVAARTTIICGLVLSIPLIARIPALSLYLDARPLGLFLAPPAWFLGVQQCLLGSREPYFARLAIAAVVGTMAVSAVAAGCSLVLYRRFDRVVLRTQSCRPPLSWHVRFRWPFERHPAQEAVQAFSSATLRRSGLHQLVFFGTLTAGLALGVNSVIGAIDLHNRWLTGAVLGAPLTVISAAVIGLRAALLLPANLRAAWIFRLTEEAGTRRHQLDAVRRLFLVLGVMMPIALAFPLQAGVLGLPGALACLPVLVLLGWILIELMIVDWRRIPFTCTVLFGKHPLALTLLVVVPAFHLFISVGTALQQIAMSGARPMLIVLAILLLISSALRWYRLQSWGRMPLEFEDFLPDSLQTLGLQWTNTRRP